MTKRADKNNDGKNDGERKKQGEKLTEISVRFGSVVPGHSVAGDFAGYCRSLEKNLAALQEAVERCAL